MLTWLLVDTFGSRSAFGNKHKRRDRAASKTKSVSTSSMSTTRLKGDKPSHASTKSKQKKHNGHRDRVSPKQEDRVPLRQQERDWATADLDDDEDWLVPQELD